MTRTPDLLVVGEASYQLYLQVKSTETMEWEMSILDELELPELQQRLYKRLEGKRYFIVLDDMWDDADWDEALAGVFPDEGNGSRFLLTIRTPLPESSDKPRRHRVLDCSQGRFNDSIYGNKHIRSLVVRRGAQPYLFTTSFSSYWISFQLLKILDFEGCVSMKQLPISIAALIGLRYLSFRNTGISQIPLSLPRLVNLEVLDMRGLANVEMSDVFGKMRRLRRLYASSFYFKKEPAITGLKFLQTLSYVNFDESHSWKVIFMTSVSELGINLFRISDSSRFYDIVRMLKNLVHLKLRYCKNMNLDMLGSLHRVTRLKIHGEIPVLPLAFPPNLSHLTLDRCLVNQDPMPLLQNLPKLKYLKLDYAYVGAEMVISYNGFLVLRVMILNFLSGLESVVVEEGAMPELRRVEIKRCSRLERLPEEMMRNLEELKIVGSKKVAAKLRGEECHVICNVRFVQIIDD